ncbi:MAG: hypothetical protein LUQ55_02810 [Methanomassiliicoccales archaeon]|nr:hypothetical protein [Methanomassiliicoccales archaeon]
MGTRECELTGLCEIAQKRKEEIAREYPDVFATEKMETDETLGMEYVVVTLRKDGEVKGFEFIENASTFLTESKAERYVDILKRGYYLEIVVPAHTRDHVSVLRSQFRDKELMNPVFFVYDEHGNINRV